MSINELTNIQGVSADQRAREQADATRFTFQRDLERGIERGIAYAIRNIEVDSPILMSEQDKARMRLSVRLTIRYGIANHKAKMNWIRRWIAKSIASLLGFMAIASASGALPYYLLSNGNLDIQPYLAVFMTEIFSVIALWGLFQVTKAWGDIKEAVDTYQRYKNNEAVIGLRGKSYPIDGEEL